MINVNSPVGEGVTSGAFLFIVPVFYIVRNGGRLRNDGENFRHKTGEESVSIGEYLSNNIFIYVHGGKCENTQKGNIDQNPGSDMFVIVYFPPQGV